MIATLKVKGKLRFINTKNDLTKFFEVFSKNDNVFNKGVTLLVNAELQSKPSSTTSYMLGYLCSVARKRSVDIIIVGDNEARFDRRVLYLQDGIVNLDVTPIYFRRTGEESD